MTKKHFPRQYGLFCKYTVCMKQFERWVREDLSDTNPDFKHATAVDASNWFEKSVAPQLQRLPCARSDRATKISSAAGMRTLYKRIVANKQTADATPRHSVGSRRKSRRSEGAGVRAARAAGGRGRCMHAHDAGGGQPGQDKHAAAAVAVTNEAARAHAAAK